MALPASSRLSSSSRVLLRLHPAVEVGEPGRLDGAAGLVYIEIPVTVTAVTTNGTGQRFRGSYVLRRVNDVPGSTPEQRRWHLYSAKLTQVN